MRGCWCLFNVSFWHLHFRACLLGGEPSAPEFRQSFPAVRVVEQARALCWEPGPLSSALGLPLTGSVASPLGLCHTRSQVTGTSRLNISGHECLFFPSSSLKIKISQHSPLYMTLKLTFFSSRNTQLERMAKKREMATKEDEGREQCRGSQLRPRGRKE